MKSIFASIILFVSAIFGVKSNSPITIPVVTNKIENQSVVATTSPKLPSVESKTQTKPTIAKKISTTTTASTINTKQIQVVDTRPKISFETINVNTRKSIVNILCSTDYGGPISPISGSGAVISSDGVILTNAHIGQFFLLKDFNGQKDSVQCDIRTGNPAKTTYKAKLLYISSTWIAENKDLLIAPVAKGTGEHDYAFLKITGKVDGTALDTIPYLPVNLTNYNPSNTYALLASYPAGFLGGQSILQNLYQSSAITQIKDIFTFGSSTVDLISVPGTVVSQKGSSGGAVVDDRGNLIGIIATESDANTTGSRDLRAITTSYINRDLKNESGSDISDLLAFPDQYAQNFNDNIAPKLTEILTNAILKK